MSDLEIPLGDVIQQLRDELLSAVKRVEGHELRFKVEEIELEMQVLVTKGGSAKTGAKGGLKFWVLNAESAAEVQGKYEASRLQKVRLKLKPETPTGGTIDLSAEME